MTAALLDFPEVPARDRLREAQERLAVALATAETAAASLARGKEHLGVLERLRGEAQAEIVDEARSMAETFAENGVVAMIGGAAQRDREIKDELSSFAIAFEILVQKNASAQRAIVDAEAGIEAGIKAVVAEETQPLLCRLRDCESAAAMLRSQLRALQFSGRWGLCPEMLPRQLLREPVNVHHPDRPLAWEQQNIFDRRKAAWVRFADSLREDADAQLNLDA